MNAVEAPPRRLDWACGPSPAPRCLNSDRRDAPDLPVLEIRATLQELRRVRRPGGEPRLGLPELDRALTALDNRERESLFVEATK